MSVARLEHFVLACEDEQALAVADERRQMSFGQLREAVLAVAGGLRSLGVAPGDRVIVALPNTVSFVISHFAVLAAGGVSVPCDPKSTAQSVAGLIADCQPVLAIAEPSLSVHFAGLRVVVDGPVLAAANDPAVQNCTACSTSTGAAEVAGATEKSPAELGTSGLIAASLEALERGPGLDATLGDDDESLAALMYTTGSTGLPRGVRLSHRNVMAAVANICEFVNYSKADREVVTLPLTHSFGLGHLYCNLRSGGAVMLHNGLTRPGRVLKSLRDFGATGFPGTPLGFGLLLDQFSSVLGDLGKGLRFSVINSAALPPERTEQLRALLPKLEVFVYYGLTEASRTTFISLTKAGPSMYRSVGTPMKGVQVRVVNGELQIKAPTVTQGYWRNEPETAHAFDDGWFRSGDLGRLDDDGHVFLTGRLKELINVGGYKVNPLEVERVLAAAAGVRDVAVAGVEGLGSKTSETLVAAVVAGEGFDADACLRFCAEQLEQYKVPTRVVLLTAIPRSATGKVLRPQLRTAVAEQVKE